MADLTESNTSPGLRAIYPRSFSSQNVSDPTLQLLTAFFEKKGLAALLRENHGRQWYDDWIAYQAEHRIYASLLSPKSHSTLGHEFDVLKLTRFLEAAAYFSPAHGYSLHVTFLGLFAILSGGNPDLKKEAVAALESGKLLAFAVSEKSHGSDLLANEFTLEKSQGGHFIANGKKYYIGNANAAAMMTILARSSSNQSKRALPALFAFRPQNSPAFCNLRKIPTLGIQSAYIGDFEIKNHELPESDIIAQGRQGWDALFATITLGKFFLGFGSIGICEHALQESLAHLTTRILYGKPVIEMPHIAALVGQSYARLTAMKLYAFRALDYVQSATADDRRYLLYTAVQKAKVSTEGVKVMANLSECIGAKGFESDTYFESALRDAQLIPGLEGSTHVNLTLAAQFIPNYFADFDRTLAAPKSLISAGETSAENPYLYEARASALHTVKFPHVLRAFAPLKSIPNVHIFVRQVNSFRLFLRHHQPKESDTRLTLAVAQCLATIAYGGLIAENALILKAPPQVISTIFHLLVSDLGVCAVNLASLVQLDAASQTLFRGLIAIPKTADADWGFVLQRASSIAESNQLT